MNKINIITVCGLILALSLALNNISKRITILEKHKDVTIEHMSSQLRFDILVRNTMFSNGMWKMQPDNVWTNTEFRVNQREGTN